MRPKRLSLKLLELWYEPATKLFLAFVAAILIVVIAYAGGDIPDPMHSQGLGPQWECDLLRGAHFCVKDVKPPTPPRAKTQP